MSDRLRKRPTAEVLAADAPDVHRRGPAPRILVVDDETSIASFLRMGLAREGYGVTVATDGPAALICAAEAAFDLAILDVMLPGITGVEVCRRLRGDPNLMILMLTARDTIADRVTGLDAGADDYIVKPFDFEELLAHVRALLRRRFPAQDTTHSAGPFCVDDATRIATVNGIAVDLAPREYDLLKTFLVNPRQVLTRDVILNHVWGPSYFGGASVVDVYVGYLRRKLDPEHRYIQTVRGLGYRLVA